MGYARIGSSDADFRRAPGVNEDPVSCHGQ